MAEPMLANFNALPPDHKLALGAAGATLIVVLAAKMFGGGGKGRGKPKRANVYGPGDLGSHLRDWQRIPGVVEFMNRLGQNRDLKNDARDAFRALVEENDHTTLRKLMVDNSQDAEGERRLTHNNARRIVRSLWEHHYGS